ncbi:hypothetical protein [Agrobacterium tumefaciens]|uniref:hypothetical protein n=1 Tax=Agrobacterium tumefaciens TaxID=358 RepID=UPI0009B8F796|nr:hypothetical protein [Agrobacterium tumefaciens]
MVRKPLSKSTETDVLVKSRRRCCICYALNRDATIKRGQIAHIDRNSSNNAFDNLAFLCLEHHDWYDSATSQSKRIAALELKEYRQELFDHLGSALAQKVHFGEIMLPPSDRYAGSYIGIGTEEDPAEITFTPLPDTYEGDARYFIVGEAYHGISREYGPNMGIMDHVGVFYEQDRVSLSNAISPDTENRSSTEILFIEEGYLQVTETIMLGLYGMGVTFEGIYRKVR